MARRQRTRGPQVHPTGPLETVDNDWKAEVRAEMIARGWTQDDLAEKIGASPGTMTNLFKPGPRQTRFRAKIEELFKVKRNARLEELLKRAERKWPRLS